VVKMSLQVEGRLSNDSKLLMCNNKIPYQEVFC
jgi:hypothetical protein